MNAKCELDKAAGALLMRAGMGLLFLIAAAGKFMMGTEKFRGYIFEQFKDTWLPQFALAPYAYALPYAELAIGILLILGLFRCLSIALSMLLMLSLTFGMMVAQKHDVVGANMTYLFFLGALLFVSRWDVFCADTLWRKPKS